ncbi:DNA polymerase [Brucella abortus]|nr:DNA polymerase [Brucella abortus]
MRDEIYALAGEKFTIGSPKQLGDILFGKMGLPAHPRPSTGQWSTSAQVLEDLAAEGHPLLRKIVDWRQLTKLKSTYTDALPGFINPQTKRVHTLLCNGIPPRRGAFPRPTPICRIFRCAPQKAARSGQPSSPNPATS